MAYQSVFQRYELKYLLTPVQKKTVMEAAAPYLVPDEYGRTTIRNLYFDTDNYRLARHSIGKPAYKEKLRIRSYCQAKPDSTVFVELKKKYRQVVFKRRIPLPEEAAMQWICGGLPCPESTQISREIDYFLSFYEGLRPKVFLSYEREAYYSRDNPDFRVTFDASILSRRDGLSLQADVSGTPLLPEGKMLMEVKCAGGIPLWMTRVLSENRIYKTSFSKYGTAYEKLIFPQFKETANYA